MGRTIATITNNATYKSFPVDLSLLEQSLVPVVPFDWMQQYWQSLYHEMASTENTINTTENIATVVLRMIEA